MLFQQPFFPFKLMVKCITKGEDNKQHIHTHLKRQKKKIPPTYTEYHTQSLMKKSQMPYRVTIE